MKKIVRVIKTAYEVSKPHYMSCGVVFRREEKMSNGSIHGYTWQAETLGM